MHKMKHLESSIVRIKNNLKNQIVGAGFIIKNSYETIIVTCAHVVESAISANLNAKEISELIWLEFPFCQKDSWLKGKIVSFSKNYQDGSDDIAIIELLDPPPPNIKAVKMVIADSYYNHNFISFGFLKGYEGSGRWIEGKLLLKNVTNLLQCVGTSDFGYFVEKGFSGSPVFDLEVGGIIGMMVSTDTPLEAKTASIITIDQIAQIYNQFQYEKIFSNADRSGGIDEYTKMRISSKPNVIQLAGRSSELRILEEKCFQDKLRLAFIAGMGGIGKSTLISVFVDLHKDNFDFISWIDLRNPIHPEDLLDELIKLFSNQTNFDTSANFSSKIEYLLEYLTKNRCLILLDNFESVLDSKTGQAKSKYRDNFELYEFIINRLAHHPHKSLLLITSRVVPNDIDLLSRAKEKADILFLKGLSIKESVELLSYFEIFGTEEDRLTLAAYYAGNPFAIKLCASFICEWYDGLIGSFLKDNILLLGDLENMIQEQIERVSPIGQKLLFWLAIERRPLTMSELSKKVNDWAITQDKKKDGGDSNNRMLIPVSKSDIVNYIVELHAKSLVEKNGKYFSLHPVILDFLTQFFLTKFKKEIINEEPVYLLDYPIILTHAHEYIKESQTHLLLYPLIKYLKLNLSDQALQSKLKCIIETERKNNTLIPNFLAGNILNIIFNLNWQVSDFNFSNLYIWQACLTNQNLAGANFKNSSLAHCSFTQTFGLALSVSFSPDGNSFGVGTSNGEIRLLKTETGENIHILKGHNNWVNAIAFSPNSSYIASSGWDKIIKIWDVKSGELIKTILGHEDKVRCLSFSNNSKFLASGGTDGTMRVWNTETFTEYRRFYFPNVWVMSLAFNPDGSYLYGGYTDGKIRIWNIESQEITFTINAHQGQIWAIDLNKTGTLIASAGDDPEIRIWDSNEYFLFKSFTGHKNRVKSLSFNYEDCLLASGSIDNSVKVWDLESGNCIQTFTGYENWVDCIDFSPVNNRLLSGSSDQQIKLWEAFEGKLILQLKGYSNQLWSVCFFEKSKILVSGSSNGQVQFWNLENNSLLTKINLHENRVKKLKVIESKSLLVSASFDFSIKVWDLVNNKLKFNFKDHTDQIWDLDICPEDKLIVSGSNDNSVKIFNIETSTCEKIIQEKINRVRSVAFVNKNVIAIGSNEPVIRLWEFKEQCNNIQKLEDPDKLWTWTLVASNDGSSLYAAGTGDVIRIWDLRKNKLRHTLKGHNNRIWCLDLSKDNRFLVSAGEDRKILVWDLDTLSILHEFSGHQGIIWDVKFSPDQRFVVSCGEDERIKFWDINNGEQINSLILDRPYEGMEINNIQGLSNADIENLKQLGASY